MEEEKLLFGEVVGTTPGADEEFENPEEDEEEDDEEDEEDEELV